MNLYRLDYQHPDGSESPVTDWLGVCLIRNAKDAWARASSRAGETGRPVSVTRIQGAGRMKRMKVAMPDGTFKAAA